jgi:5-methylcytosine-specific restriction endonuclease McrA
MFSPFITEQGFFMRDDRSAEAAHYRRLYAQKQWRHLRKQVLLRDLYRCQHPGCGKHLTGGRSHHSSAVVHHVKAHKGDLDLFYDASNLQSVCWSCHSGAIQSEEALGYDTTIGPDGWPTDPAHPSVK